MTKAIAYLRTSSATNGGKDKDSEPRQRLAIEGYAASAGFELVGEFYDLDVSGAEPIENRPGFAAMLDRIEGNGVRTIIVEDASRFARELMVQEAGIALMQARGVRVLSSNGDDLTDSKDAMRVMMRQIIGAVVQFEKARLVGKLKGARDRKSAAAGRRIEGQKGYAGRNPEVVQAIRAIRAADPQATLQQIVDQLTADGVRTSTGAPLLVQQVSRICRMNGIGKGGTAVE